MEPGGRQYRENRVRAVGSTKETSLKIEQASRERTFVCVCVCVSQSRLAAQQTLEISLFRVRGEIHCTWRVYWLGLSGADYNPVDAYSRRVYV